MIDLQKVGRALDRAFNEDRRGPRRTGFLLLVFGFGAPGVANYVSNGTRAEMIRVLRETADRLERNQDNPRFRGEEAP